MIPDELHEFQGSGSSRQSMQAFTVLLIHCGKDSMKHPEWCDPVMDDMPECDNHDTPDDVAHDHNDDLQVCSSRWLQPK